MHDPFGIHPSGGLQEKLQALAKLGRQAVESVGIGPFIFQSVMDRCRTRHGVAGLEPRRAGISVETVPSTNTFSKPRRGDMDKREPRTIVPLVTQFTPPR